MHYVPAGYVQSLFRLWAPSSLLLLSTADKVSGRRQTFRITWLQMERIISSKAQKYSLAWCRVLLRELRVSNHLPQYHAVKINIKEYMNGRCCREMFHGFHCPAGAAIWSVSFAALSLCNTYSQWIPGMCSSIWTLSVSTIIRWPAVGLLAGAICRPLSLNSRTYCALPYLL